MRQLLRKPTMDHIVLDDNGNVVETESTNTPYIITSMISLDMNINPYANEWRCTKTYSSLHKVRLGHHCKFGRLLSPYHVVTLKGIMRIRDFLDVMKSGKFNDLPNLYSPKTAPIEAITWSGRLKRIGGNVCHTTAKLVYDPYSEVWRIRAKPFLPKTEECAFPRTATHDDVHHLITYLDKILTREKQ